MVCLLKRCLFSSYPSSQFYCFCFPSLSRSLHLIPSGDREVRRRRQGLRVGVELSKQTNPPPPPIVVKERKGGREEGRKGGREEGRKGGREEGRKGGREEGRKGGREEGRKGGRRVLSRQNINRGPEVGGDAGRKQREASAGHRHQGLQMPACPPAPFVASAARLVQRSSRMRPPLPPPFGASLAKRVSTGQRGRFREGFCAEC